MPAVPPLTARFARWTIRKPYGLIGATVIAGLLVIGILGMYGATGPGLLDARTAFFITGGAIVVLTLASLYLMFTMNDVIRVLHVHQQRLPALQRDRDAAQDQRIAALEEARLADPAAMGAVASLEERVAQLERKVSSQVGHRAR